MAVVNVHGFEPPSYFLLFSPSSVGKAYDLDSAVHAASEYSFPLAMDRNDRRNS